MSAPAGWYQHPQHPDFEAYWDGAQWTPHTRPKQAPPAAQAWSATPMGHQVGHQVDHQVGHQAEARMEDAYSGPAGASFGATSHSWQAAPEGRTASNGALFKILGGVAAALVLLVGSFLVVGRLKTSGAASPEEVGEKLMQALEGGDLLGVIDVLHPAEREVLRDPFVRGIGEMKRLGVASAAMEPGSKLFSYDVENLTVTATPVSDDIANVMMSASVTSSFNQDIALGPVFDGLSGWEEVRSVGDLMKKVAPESLTPSSEEVSDMQFTAVRYEGRWYASLGYTIAEEMRAESNTPMPQAGVTLVGGASPEEAVRSYVASLETLNLEGLIAGLHPGEFGALQRYAPMFLADAQEELKSSIAEQAFSWKVTALELEQLSKNGSSANVRIKRLGMNITYQDGTVVLDLEHTGSDVKATVTTDGETKTYSLKEALDEARTEGTITANEDALWKSTLSLTVREWNGSWYLAPISTITEYLFQALAQVTQPDVRKALEEIGDLDDALGGFGIGSSDSSDFSSSTDLTGSESSSDTPSASEADTSQISRNAKWVEMSVNDAISSSSVPVTEIPALVKQEVLKEYSTEMGYVVRLSEETPTALTFEVFDNLAGATGTCTFQIQPTAVTHSCTS